MAMNNGFSQLMEEVDNSGFFKILRKSYLLSESMRIIPNDFITSIYEENLSAKMVIEVPWETSWTIKIFRNSRFYYMDKTDWDQFLKDNGLGNNEFITFNHKGNMCFSVEIFQMDTMATFEPPKSATVASSSRGIGEETEWKCPGLKTEYTEPNLGNKEAEKSKKRHIVPAFRISITKTYLIYLGVPAKFADKYMPEEKTMFKIHHGKKTWEVMYVVSDIKRRFSGGWIGLVKDIGLVVGDVCTFKLINPTEMVLQVSNDKKTP